MKNNQIAPYIIFSIIFMLIPISSFLATKGIYFPIDDAYITINQAKNLIDGNIFSYSNSDIKTNSNTSFIFYIITSFFILINKNIFNIEDWITATVIANFILNFSLILMSIRLFIILINNKIKYTYVAFSTPAIIFSYMCGLETGLSILLILLQYYFFKNKKMSIFIILSCILAINRPENIILNFAYLFLLIKNKTINKNNFYFYIPILAVNAFLPILNYIYINDFRPSSFSRVNFNLSNTINNLINLIVTPSINPGFLPNSITSAWKYLKIIYGLMLITFFYSITKNLFHKIKNHVKIKEFSIIFIVLIYCSAPLLSSTLGEFNRYISPTYLLLLIFLINNFAINTYLISMLTAYNLLVFLFCLLSYVNMTTLIDSTIRPVALYASQITDSKSITAIDSAGYLSLFVNGKIIDVYGLGTMRYAKVHGNFPAVYNLLKSEELDYIITWPSSEPKYYLDSAHYSNALKNKKINLIFSSPSETFTSIDNIVPESLNLYKVSN